MYAYNLQSNKGNLVTNQIVVESEGNTYFISYGTVIVRIAANGSVFLDEDYWNYSVTTSKYRNMFLNETTKETEKKIKSGEYSLISLND